MKRYFFFFLIFILNINFSFSQKERDERRVYYLDVTDSMVKNKLWTPVRNALKNAIDSIDDDCTEIVVIPFSHHNFPLISCEQKATADGKEKLKKFIEDLSTVSKDWGTDIYLAYEDFYKNQIKQNKINYFFLLTDGEQQLSRMHLRNSALDKWQNNLGDDNVFGFHIMLDVKDKTFGYNNGDEIKKRLWALKTMNVNINLIRFKEGCTYNVRNDGSIKIPISSGKIDGINFTLSLNNKYYRLKSQKQEEDCIYLELDHSNYDESELPENEQIKLSLTSKGKGKFDFVLSDYVIITCVNKKEKSIRPTFNRGAKIEKLGKVSYYPTFSWSKAKTDTLVGILYLNFSKDAKSSHNAYAEFKFTGKDGKSISGLHIFKDSKELKDHKFRVNSDRDSIILSFVFDPSADAKKYRGYLKLVNHNLDKDGDTALEHGQINNSLQWQINYEKNMNPWLLGLIWVLIIFVAGVLLWMFVFRSMFYPRFKSIQKTFNVPGMAPLIVRSKEFKGARMVVIASKHQKKQSLWNRFWTGKIVYKSHPAFISPIVLKPAKGRKVLVKVQAGNYQVLPNPMPGVGVATIVDIKKNLKISVN